MLKKTKKNRMRTDAGDESGNVAIIAALMLSVLIISAGMAVDYSRAISEVQALTAAADSAALASVTEAANQQAAGATDWQSKGQAIGDAMFAANEQSGKFSKATTHSIDFTLASSKLTATVNFTAIVPTTLMQIVNIKTIKLKRSVAAEIAMQPTTPTAVTFTPTGAQGVFWKQVTLWVHRPGDATDTKLATYVYQPTDRNAISAWGSNGVGTLTSNPPGKIDLGTYDKLYLRMDVNIAPCKLGLDSAAWSPVTCAVMATAPTSYLDVLRTDNAYQSANLFVDGTQLPSNVVPSITTLMPCGRTEKFSWEDGGGWSAQDFYFDITAECGTAGEQKTAVLTK